MKKNIIILFIALCPVLVFTQKITVSEPIVLRSDIAYDLIGEFGGRTLLFRNQNNSFEVVAFNEQMKEAWSKEVVLDDRQPRVAGTVSGKGDFTIIYSYKKKSDLQLKAHKFGPGANLIDSVNIADLGYLFYTPEFEIVESDDRSKILIYHIEKQNMIKAFSFDVKNMKLLWKTSLMPEDFNFYQNFRQILVDNNGNMTLILERNNYRSKRESHYFEIHSFYGEDKRLVQYNVPMANKLTYDVHFTYDHLNDRLVAAGFFSEKNLGRADGYFYLNIPPLNHDGFLMEFRAFNEEFLSTLLGKEADKTKGLSETDIQDVVLRMDGGVLLLAERARTYERRSASMNRTFYDANGRFAVDYYYDEVFAISIHPDGETHWNTVLHKKQYSQDDDGIYSSYFLFKTPTSLRFLFNDEIKYENTVSEYVLKGNGNFERNSLLSTDNLKLRLRFRDAIQINASQLIIPSERRNRLKLVRLEYY